MKTVLIHLLVSGMLISLIHPAPASGPMVNPAHESAPPRLATDRTDLSKAAYQVLDTKCNVCHRKQNPFRVFSEKNMAKNAPRIYDQVFVKRRMPRGNKITLTASEYQTLEQWLNTQNID